MSRVLAVLLVVGALLLTQNAWRRKTIIREWSEEVQGASRFVDAGIVLHVVVADRNGQELLSGRPPVRVIRTHRFGGTIDTKSVPPRFVAPSAKPVVWYCSEQQEAVIVHSGTPLGVLCYGSEGAGKTRALAMWHAIRWLEHVGFRQSDFDRMVAAETDPERRAAIQPEDSREGGQTAPTNQRIDLIRREMFSAYPRSWYKYRGVPSQTLTFCDGTRIKLVSTHRQSEAQGSPIQGFNWSWCGRDEAQDQIDVHQDIESRGRASRNGGTYYRQLATATAKDDSDWKNLRDQLIGGGAWEKRELSIYRSPFISDGFLDTKAASMSEREFLRRYGRPDGTIDDLPPELAVYPAWSRTHNLIVVPEIGWTDVTEQELRPWGPNLHALVGHDPGSLFDVSLILKAYKHGRMARPLWVVIGEVTTEQTTTEQHVDALLEWAHERHFQQRGRDNTINKRLLVRADPHSGGLNSDNRPARETYTIFRNAGITIHPAAYTSGGSDPGRIPKREGIEVINTLLCSARQERRLFVAKDKDGRVAAPMLVKSIETSEKDHEGKAETHKKDKKDLSHWTASLRYALWAIERPRLQAASGGVG